MIGSTPVANSSDRFAIFLKMTGRTLSHADASYEATRLILRRLLHMLDHENVYRSFLCFELQAELFLNCRK